MKDQQCQCPNVQAVATVIAQGEKMLLVFNPRWGGFTLPMSKRKEFQDSVMGSPARPEVWQKAAARVAAEVLGRSFGPEELPQLLCEIKDYEQSDADGVWKLYTIQVFGWKMAEEARLAPGVAAEWLGAEDIRLREPMTRTVRFILARLQEQGLLPPWK